MSTDGKANAFCELLKLAIERAPDDDARAKLQSLRVEYCSGVTAQGDTGDNTPPPKQ